MDDRCGRPFFGRRTTILGHCVLQKGHSGFPEACMMQVETKKTDADDDASQDMLDFDLTELTEHWKPIRDLPDGELPTGIIADEI